MNELRSFFPIKSSTTTKAKSPKRYIAYILLAVVSYTGGRYFSPATADVTEAVQLSSAIGNEEF